MKRLMPLLLLALLCALPLEARRTVSPVGSAIPTKTAQPSGDESDLPDPADQFVDSIAEAQPKAIGNVYPLWEAVDVSVDLWPALNRAFRSGYGIVGFGARLSLHNRYFPAFEAGISSANKTPDGMNYSFRSPLAPYFKIGMDYNFLYNSNPDYKAFALVRYGLSSFEYRFTDVDLGSSYWDTDKIIDFPWRRSTVGYIEVGAGLQVKLFSQLAAGWSFRYHHVIHHSRQPNGSPWAVPGFGTAGSSLGITLSLTYTFKLHSSPKKQTQDTDSQITTDETE